MTFDLKSYAETVRVTDGAWGTLLQQRGLKAGSPPELWNADNPEAVETVARLYIEAGSDAIITNTFGSNRLVLAGHGAGDRAGELTRAGVAISRRAADVAKRGGAGDVKVFASIGPTGKIVMMEELPQETFTEAFAECAAAAAEGGADAIVLESFAELAEISLAIRAAREAAPELPVVASMTFSSGPDRTATMMGDSPGDLTRAAAEHDAHAVGANCGVGPDNYVKVARLFREATDLPVWIKANAGLPEVGPDGQTRFPMGPEAFAACVPELVAGGANLVGGCCGTMPEHIRAVARAVRGG